jgi:hypothetical protein
MNDLTDFNLIDRLTRQARDQQGWTNINPRDVLSLLDLLDRRERETDALRAEVARLRTGITRVRAMEYLEESHYDALTELLTVPDDKG